MANTTLIDRIQSLPQELINMISEYTFTATTSQPIVVQYALKAPACLHVDRATRQKFAQDYFEHSTFNFRTRIEFCAWLKAQSKEHQRMIKTLRYDLEPSTGRLMNHVGNLDLVELADAKLGRLYSEIGRVSAMRLSLEPSEGGPDVKVSLLFNGKEEVVWTANPDEAFDELSVEEQKDWKEYTVLDGLEDSDDDQ